MTDRAEPQTWGEIKEFMKKYNIPDETEIVIDVDGVEGLIRELVVSKQFEFVQSVVFKNRSHR